MSPMPRRLFAVAGQRFGLGTVIDPEVTILGPGQKPVRAARLRCDCGTEYTALLANLFRPGHTKSCGCWRRGKAAAWAATGKPGTTHGLSAHPLFELWRKMIARCENPGHRAYADYGGRGIRVCDRWHDMRLFIEDIEREIGPRPEGAHDSGRVLYSLDRIDNDGNYQPGNVRWATSAQQSSNQRKRGRAA